jgi:hypothetical protein
MDKIQITKYKRKQNTFLAIRYSMNNHGHGEMHMDGYSFMECIGLVGFHIDFLHLLLYCTNLQKEENNLIKKTKVYEYFSKTINDGFENVCGEGAAIKWKDLEY